jgi:hypothetical protein
MNEIDVNPERINDEKKQKLTKGQKWIAAILFIFLLGWLFGGTDYDIEDGVAKLSIELSSSYSVESAAFEVLSEVYDVAQDNTDIKQIDLTILMSKAGLSDKYGNDLEEDIIMGSMTYDQDDIEEIRKYKENYMYTSNDIQKAVVIYKIKQLKGAHLLED